jgi:hypothetical protein
MIGPSTNTARFGGPFSAALSIGQSAGADWYQIYQPDQDKIPANYVFPPPPRGVNLGATVGSTVPEPSMGALAALATADFCLLRRRSGRQ